VQARSSSAASTGLMTKMKSKNKCVYLHKKKSTGEVFYVGIGNKIRSRAKDGRSKLWWRIVEKHGYDIEVIEDGLTWDEAVNREIELISKYGRRDRGEGTLVNHTDGGEGSLGMVFTDEMIEQRRQQQKKLWQREGFREHMSNVMKGNTYLSDWAKTPEGMAQRERIVESQTGEGNPFYGRTHTDETKKAISLANKGRLSGENNHMYGKYGSEHQAAKSCTCMLTGKVVGSAVDVAEITQRNRITVRGYLRKNNPRTKPHDFHWVYTEQKIEQESQGKKYCIQQQKFV